MNRTEVQYMVQVIESPGLPPEVQYLVQVIQSPGQPADVRQVAQVLILPEPDNEAAAT